MASTLGVLPSGKVVGVTTVLGVLDVQEKGTVGGVPPVVIFVPLASTVVGCLPVGSVRRADGMPLGGEMAEEGVLDI